MEAGSARPGVRSGGEGRCARGRLRGPGQDHAGRGPVTRRWPGGATVGRRFRVPNEELVQGWLVS
eukprot:6006553-Alexandrium_andersonii.AAC.1